MGAWTKKSKVERSKMKSKDKEKSNRQIHFLLDYILRRVVFLVHGWRGNMDGRFITFTFAPPSRWIVSTLAS